MKRIFVPFFILIFCRLSAGGELDKWRNILSSDVATDSKVQAVSEILKIQPSRSQARFLAQIYFKEKDNKQLRLAILNELVKTKTITAMDGWQKEIMSSEYSYDDRLRLNFLSLREGALRRLYKESNAFETRQCEFDRNKLKLEVRQNPNEAKNYLWISSGFHLHFTGVTLPAVEGLPLPDCKEIEFLNLTTLHGALFWERAGGHLITFERRYFRPIGYLDFKDREEFSKISQKKGEKTCFLPALLEQNPTFKKAWVCIR